MLRKLLAVIAGYGAWSVLWLVANSTARAVAPGSFGEDGSLAAGMLLACLALSVVFSLIAGWLASSIAPGTRGPALWTGFLLLLTGIPVQLANWSVIPLWYHLPFLALLLPATVLGGSIRRAPRRSGAVGAAA